jgi:FkbM family methyltransferase
VDTPTETRTDLVTPRGNSAVVVVRHGTSDLSLAGAFFTLWGVPDDEYDLAALHVDGVFLDIGAHIGMVTISVLLDNPDASAVCVEPLAENCDMIRRNAEANGLLERVTILQAAVGAGRTADVAYDYTDDPESNSTYFHDNRFVGSMAEQAHAAQSVATVPTVTLAQVIKDYGPIAAVKLDCEGCEWRLLREKAVSKVPVIFGEWHGHAVANRAGEQTLHDLLGGTHDVEVLRDMGGTGNFRAVRR